MFGDERLKRKIRELKTVTNNQYEIIQDLEAEKSTLDRDKRILVQKVERLTKFKAIPMDSMITVKHEHNSFLMIADRDDMIMLPNGHKGYDTRFLYFLVDIGVHYGQTWYVAAISTCHRYLTTEGALAYLHGGKQIAYVDGTRKDVDVDEHENKLLLEVLPEKETRIYPTLQQLVRQKEKVILKVTFPDKETLTRDRVREILGLRVRQNSSADPKVEIVFE